MKKKRNSGRPERLEKVIGDLITAAASMRAPVVWCITFAVAINSLCLVLPSWNSSFWATPIIGICGLVWLVIVNSVFRYVSFRHFHIEDLLVGLGFKRRSASESSFLGASIWLPAALVIISAFPGSFGAIFNASLFLSTMLFLLKGQNGLKAMGILLACLGVVFLLLSFLNSEAASPVAGIFSLTSLLVLAIAAFSTTSLAQSVFRLEGLCAVSCLLLLLPLAAVGGSGRFLIPTLFVCAFIVPAGLLLFFFFQQKNCIARCRRITANLRASLESVEDIARCEDEVRESDGYFRVCEPRYSHLRSNSVGETGYISWPEHDGLIFPNTDGEWCIARAITSSPSPILAGRDLRGADLRKVFDMCAAAIAPLVADSNLESFLERIRKRWHLRKFRGQNEHEYFKMPWESGEVLAIPCIFTCSFVYPTGSGILDCSGLPCEARSVRVQITLKQDVVSDFKAGGKSKDESSSNSSSRLARSLVWHIPLVIPSTYEGILRILISEMKKWNSLTGIDQTALQTALSSRAQECFDDELRRLVSLQITSVDVVQSAIIEQDRDIHRKVNEFKTTLPGRKTAEVRLLESLVRGQVYVQNEILSKTKVYNAVREIQKRLNDGVKEFDEAVAAGMSSVGRDGVETSIVGEGVEIARTMVHEHVRELRETLLRQQIRLIDSFNEIDQAFSRTP